ncbi:MAG: response regulator [Synergistaceae bacterium]|nr:response regulator [Synergistaceae bacterium]
MENDAALHSILIVDDDATNLRMLQEILKSVYKVYASPSGERALVFLENRMPDLIMLDVEMPGMKGYELLKRLKADERLASVPVLFLTAQEGRDNEEEAFRLGAVDYILKPVSAGVVRARVNLHIALGGYRKKLEKLVDQKTERLGKAQDSVLKILSGVAAWRDAGENGHIERAAAYVSLAVKGLLEADDPAYRITPEYGDRIIKASRLHDIGHVAIPDSILLKPEPLTPEEFAVMKTHAVIGAAIIEDAINDIGDDSSFLAAAREIAISHHEWWNGKGYPNALFGAEIPLSGRIMAVADTYDSLTADSPYKPALSHEEAMRIIRDETGRHFDPRMMEIMEKIFPAFAEMKPGA